MTAPISKKIVSILICLIILLSAPGAAYCGDTYVRNIFITNSPTHLKLQFQLYNSLNGKMEEAIQTGIPTAFDYYIELYQSRALWNDRDLTSLVVTKMIKYDTLKQEYILTEQTNVNGAPTTQVVSSLDAAMEFMNNVTVRSFYPMWKLERNRAYYLKIRARSEGIVPPGYIHYILFFVSWMNFDTDWIVESFYY